MNNLRSKTWAASFSKVNCIHLIIWFELGNVFWRRWGALQLIMSSVLLRWHDSKLILLLWFLCDIHVLLGFKFGLIKLFDSFKSWLGGLGTHLFAVGGAGWLHLFWHNLKVWLLSRLRRGSCLSIPKIVGVALTLRLWFGCLTIYLVVHLLCLAVLFSNNHVWDR